MLRHMLDKHEGVNMSNIKWGMFVKEYKRNAFERQIQEAVNIQHESNYQEILILKAEWNQSCLPRLVTRIGGGDPKAEIRELEKAPKEKQEKKT